ncbi:UNVERIFIED_CONTAM: hypothetical protein Slati_2784700 [Sesamum latifolium]|uniref:Retrotransposon gag protein n=1 Tax=Sesamum latifolium TaxID=2727402 RepID=A0AAW2VZX6_9LAMI
MQARQDPFLDSDVSGIFDDLLEANLIDLPDMKRPEEAERRDDPKIYKYHSLVGHAIQDCFVFKDKVMQLARQGKISLEEDSTATNLVSTKCGSLDGKRASCNTTHTINEDDLLEKKTLLMLMSVCLQLLSRTNTCSSDLSLITVPSSWSGMLANKR